LKEEVGGVRVVAQVTSSRPMFETIDARTATVH
jgi:hypothetical protein